MRTATVVLVLGLLPASPFSGAAEVREWTVDPGTTGLLVEDHRVPLVSVVVEFPAGSWSPWARRNDAEAAFNIQDRDPEGVIRRRADLLAASLDLRTGDRTSSLHLSCRKDDLEAVLVLGREVIQNRNFDRSELKRRRQTTKLEWKAALKQPQFVLMQEAARALFEKGDPRRRPFEEPDLPGTDPERLAEARDTLVRLPGRVIGFAGDLTAEEASILASGFLPPPLEKPPAGIEPVPGEIRPRSDRPASRSVFLRRLTQVYFVYGRESLGYTDDDYAASLIVDHALGGHFNSRLMVALRQEEGDTYGARVVDDGGLEPGLYGLTTFTRTENAAEAEAKIREVLAVLHADGIREEERALAAGNVLGRRAFLRQSPDEILAVAMAERRLGLPIGFFDDLAERAASLTLDELNAFVKRFYDPEHFTLWAVRGKD